MWVTSENIVNDSMIGGTETDIMPTIVTLDTEVRTYIYDEKRKIEKDHVDFPDVNNPTNPVLSVQSLDNQTEDIYIFRLSRSYTKYLTPMGRKKISGIKYSRKYKTRKSIPFHLEKKIKKLINGRDDFVLHEHVFYEERGMLNFWLDFIIKKDYDIIAAFNGMAFDYPYLFNRMKMLNINYSRISPLGYVTVRIKGDIINGKRNMNDTDIRIPGRNLLDTRELFMTKIFEKRAKNGLNDFGLDILGKGKLEHDPIPGKRGRFHSIDYEFFEQIMKFLIYGAYDCIIDYYVQKVLNIWPHFIKLVKSSGCQIFHVTKSRKRVRQKTLFYAKEMGLVMEPESFGSERFKGAQVDPPNFVGKIEMAADLDLTSQYPSAIQAWNISWDTLILDHKIFTDPMYAHIVDIEEIKKENIEYCSHPLKGIYFRLDREGLFPKMITDTRYMRDSVRQDLEILSKAEETLKLDNHLDLEQSDMLSTIGYNFELGYVDSNISLIKYIRDEWDNDQKVLKVDINSIYGNLPPFLGACVTAGGRESIQFTRFIITKMKYPPVYTDTDSVIFRTKRRNGEEAIKLCDWLVTNINKGYLKLAEKFNCKIGYLDIKSEEIYNPIVFPYNKSSGYKKAAAKKYIKCLIVDRGVVLAEPKLDHKGVLKKRQSSQFAVDLGYLIIYYIGMNYPNKIIISRAKALISKFFTGSKKLDIPPDELIDLERKLHKGLHKGVYNLEDIAFPVNIRKDFHEYKVLDYIKKGIIKTNDYSFMWSSMTRKLGRGDTAFMVFIKRSSVPKEIPFFEKERSLFALNDDGFLHPDFKVDYFEHIKRAVDKYDPLLKAVGINPKLIARDPNQITITI